MKTVLIFILCFWTSFAWADAVIPYIWNPKQINACVLDYAGFLIIACIVISYLIYRAKGENALTRKKKLVILCIWVPLLLLLGLGYRKLYSWCGSNIEAVYENTYCYHACWRTYTSDARCRACKDSHWQYKAFRKYIK